MNVDPNITVHQVRKMPQKGRRREAFAFLRPPLKGCAHVNANISSMTDGSRPAGCRKGFHAGVYCLHHHPRPIGPGSGQPSNRRDRVGCLQTHCPPVINTFVRTKPWWEGCFHITLATQRLSFRSRLSPRPEPSVPFPLSGFLCSPRFLRSPRLVASSLPEIIKYSADDHQQGQPAEDASDDGSDVATRAERVGRLEVHCRWWICCSGFRVGEVVVLDAAVQKKTGWYRDRKLMLLLLTS